MVTFDEKKLEAAHKELHKRIFDCRCTPWRRDFGYCHECETAVVGFMNEYGAGVLTRDKELEDLLKQYSRVCKENGNLLKRLQKKSKRYEELRDKVKGWGIMLDSPGFDDNDAGLVRDEIKTHFHGKVTK